MLNKSLFQQLGSGLIFVVVFLYIFDFFNPYLDVKSALMDLDLSLSLERQSEGSLFKQIFWILSFFVSLLFFVKKRIKIEFNHPSQLLFLSLISYIFVSACWSDYPLISLKRSIFQLLLFGTLFLSLAQIRNRGQFLFILYLTFLILIVWEITFSILFNVYAFESNGAMSGIHKGKNQFGVVAAIGVLISLQQFSYQKYQLFNRDKLLAGFVAIAWFTLLILSKSKTCIALTVVLSFTFFSHGISFSLKRFAGLFVNGLILFIAGSMFYGYVQLDDSLAIFRQVFTTLDLTGRGEIWSLSLLSISENPIFGYGYASFWGVGEVPFYFDIDFSYLSLLNQSHNGYLDLLIQLGLVGFCIFVIFIWYLRLSYIQNSTANQFYNSVFIFTIMHNLTESSFLRDQHFTWTLLLIIFISSWVCRDETFKLAK